MEEKTKKYQMDEYLDMGRSYSRNYQFQQAIDKFQQALELAKKLKDKGKEAEANYQLGFAYKLNNQIHKAMEYFEKALEIAKEQANKKLENKAYIGLGDAYRLNNQIHNAMEYFEKALEIAKERADKNMETLTYLGFGDAYRLNKQIQKAMEYYEKALKIAKEQADKNMETRAYLGLGDVYRLNNQIQKAMEYYEKALEIAKERADKNMETRAYLGLGDAYRLNIQFQKAMEYFEKALEIAKERANKNMEAHGYLGLGKAYRLNDQKAVEYYEKALEIAKERADKKLATRAYLGLGDAYRWNNQIQKAMEYYEKALEIAKEKRYQNLARSAMQELSRSQDAVHVSHKTTTIRTPETSDDAQLSNTVNQTSIENESTTDHKVASAKQLLILGRSYQTKGQTEEAIKRYEEAVQIANETNHNDIKTRGYHQLGNVFAEKSEYKKAIEYYQKAREISPHLEGDEMEVITYQWLGYNHLQAGQYRESIERYNEVIKLGSLLGNKETKINAYLGLGSAFTNKGDFSSARKYFLKALTTATQLHDRSLEKKAYTDLGYVYYQNCKFDAAVESYLKVQKISHDLGEKKEEANASLMLGDTFQELKQQEKAIESYQAALNISKELEDKEMQDVAIQRLGTLYLTLASICIKDQDYDKAIKWYKKVLDILGKEPIDHLLQEKALTGLAVTCFNLGETEEAMESIRQAQEQYKNTDTPSDSTNVKTTHEQIHSTGQKPSYSAVPDPTEDQSKKVVTFEEKETVIIDATEDLSEKVVTFEEKETIIGVLERAEVLMDEACNLNRAERLPTEDLLLIEKYIEISPSYVYSRKILTKEPFTKEVRKAMTDDVKKLAYTNLLAAKNQEPAKNYGKFVNRDKQIFNFAKSEVFKNASTQKPAILNPKLGLYMNSVGQIACGKVRGTCFLVADEWVITNYHVYRMIKDERAELGNPTLPIKVRFGYFYPKQTEHIVTVEVDEEQDTTLENSLLDYKLFRLKQSEDLTDRVPLGAIVRNWQLSDGRVVILGHPEDKEMQEEVCVVIGCNARLDTMNKRYKECSGVHMTNEQLLSNNRKYRDLIPYDTSFFSGSSGSPVFEMNGNMVAMHTQGYLVEKSGGNSQNEEQNNIPNQQQDQHVLDHEQNIIPNQEQENTSRKYSLMEFGVQFTTICADLKQWHGEEVVKHFFPNYKLKPGEEPMDTI